MGNSPHAQLENGPKNILSPPIFSGFTNTISLKMALRILTAHLCSADFFWRPIQAGDNPIVVLYGGFRFISCCLECSLQHGT